MARKRTRAGRFIRSKGGRRTAVAVALGGATAAVLARRAFLARRRRSAVGIGPTVRAAVTDPIGFYGGLVTGPGAKAPKRRAGLIAAINSEPFKNPVNQGVAFVKSIGSTFTGRGGGGCKRLGRRRTLVGRVQNLISFSP